MIRAQYLLPLLTLALTGIAQPAPQDPATVAVAPPKGEQGPSADKPVLNSQTNGRVSTKTIRQIKPVPDLIARPEEAVEHQIPVLPPQPEVRPLLEQRWVEDGIMLPGSFLPNTPTPLTTFQGISWTGW